MDATLTMLPGRPAAIIAFAASRQQRKTPVRLTSSTRVQSSRESSVGGPAAAVPALFTRMSMLPWRSMAWATIAVTLASSTTSA